MKLKIAVLLLVGLASTLAGVQAAKATAFTCPLPQAGLGDVTTCRVRGYCSPSGDSGESCVMLQCGVKVNSNCGYDNCQLGNGWECDIFTC